MSETATKPITYAELKKLRLQVQALMLMRPVEIGKEFADLWNSAPKAASGEPPAFMEISTPFIECLRPLIEDFIGPGKLPPEDAPERYEEAKHRLASYLDLMIDPKLTPTKMVVSILVSAFRDFAGQLPPATKFWFLPTRPDFDEYFYPLFTVRLGDLVDIHKPILAAVPQLSLMLHPNAILPGSYEALRLFTEKKLKPDTPEAIEATFKGCPLLPLADVQIPVLIPDERKFEHTTVLAPSGTGKTQLLQSIIANQLPRVPRGKASIVVMDSQGTMIEGIKNLKIFAEGESHEDRLVVLDPDPEYPIALNVFSIGKIVGNPTLKQREELRNTASELLTYVFNSLLGEGAVMTSKQDTLFSYALSLCLVIPGATLHTLVEVLKPGGIAPYRKEIATLDDDDRDFFARQFDSDGFKSTKQELAWRLARLLKDKTFSRMFAAKESKVDLFDLLNSGKVILINTDKALLKASRSAVLGRFFIAMILMATQQRAVLAKEDKTACFVYVDEAHEYISNDPKITDILDQARKQNVGMTLALQRLAQITNANVRDALLTTSIKIASTDNDSDASTIARAMKVPSTFIANLPQYHFALHVRNHLPHAIQVKAPGGVIESMEKMTREEAQERDREMRERYTTNAKDIDPPEIIAEPPPGPLPPDQDEEDPYNPKM